MVLGVVRHVVGVESHRPPVVARAADMVPHRAIAVQDAPERNVEKGATRVLVLVVDHTTESGDEDASVRLSSHPQGTCAELRVRRVELLQECVERVGHAGIIPLASVLLAVTEPDGGIIDKQEVLLSAPRILIVDRGWDPRPRIIRCHEAPVVEGVRAELHEVTHQSGAAGAA